ncbi:acyl carrier protein [Aspergillus karnatakaensis]|uniref:acyl carrier protein n=1 Tax=Aspergillus karnatakaensis TaxID=1810916 RepID=UPI003CCD83A3
MDIEAEVHQIIREFLGIDEFTHESDLQHDLGADEIDVTEILMALEEQFEIDISDEIGAQIQTVGDAVSYVSSLVEEKTGEEAS